MTVLNSLWKQFLKTTVVPTIYVADSETQPRRGVVFLDIQKRLSEKTTRGQKNSFPKAVHAKSEKNKFILLYYACLDSRFRGNDNLEQAGSNPAWGVKGLKNERENFLKATFLLKKTALLIYLHYLVREKLYPVSLGRDCSRPFFL